MRGVTRWLSQPGAGSQALRKLDAIKSSIEGLSDAPLRHPIFFPNGRRKCSTSGGYEIHYEVIPDPPDSTTSGVVNVLFVKSPYQDYTTFLG